MPKTSIITELVRPTFSKTRIKLESIKLTWRFWCSHRSTCNTIFFNYRLLFNLKKKDISMTSF